MEGIADLEYRKLGRTDIEVSVIALGCWPFAGGLVWGDQDDDLSVATVHAALDAGINFFDTAEGYGDGYSEAVLGRSLIGRREEAVIATKIAPPHLGCDEVEKRCDRSLKKLRTDYIDYYQIHWPNWEIPIKETLAALERLLQKGKVRAIGVSNFGRRDLSELLEGSSGVEANQLPYSLLWRTIEHEIQPLCLERGVGVICYMPLAQGLLTSRYASASEVPDGLARTRHYSCERPLARHSEPGCETEVFEAIEAIKEISDGIGELMATTALAWVMSRPAVTSVLVGARNPEELSWNFPAVERSLSEEVIGRLDDATEGIKKRLGTNPDPWFTQPRMR